VTPSEPPTDATTATAVGFVSTVTAVNASDLGASWHEGCPVGPADLRRVSLKYWGFDDQPHDGQIVVHADVVDALAGVFRTLFDARFPIRRMHDRQVRRQRPRVDGRRQHVGVQLPVHRCGRVQPPAGAAYLDRNDVRPGIAVPGGLLVDAFAAGGWQWGGRWAGTPDYQHFSATGG
jgi:hypothetical protein